MAIEKIKNEYPKGHPSYYLDGRILRNVRFGGARGQINCIAGVADTTVAILTTARDRAAYIERINLTNDIWSDYNHQATWQLWAENRQVAGGVTANNEFDVKVYFPPNCNITWYCRVIRAVPPINAYMLYSIPFIEFDALSDVYDYGLGKLIANPLIGALAWP